MALHERSPGSSNDLTAIENWHTRTDEYPAQQSAYYWDPSQTRERFKRRKSSARTSQRRASLVLQRAPTGKQWWKFYLRPWDDDEEQDWWFASTAIPLLAATLGPLANVFSIAALVTEWRMCLVPDITKANAPQCPYDGNQLTLGAELDGISFTDPRWCYYLNLVSLIVGFIGNFFLLCNFTNRIRYIIALPASIIMWYVATGILIGITVSMEFYVPPARPQQTYTQGFWYAVIAACMYMICSMLLMVNMFGYFRGHYPQHFTLTESQRTLILQTMLFFFWLAGGGAVFSAVEKRLGDGNQNWSYVNGLYFCDVTILTVGFGDLYPTSDTGRGFVFPYSVGGIIMLGLMVSSISNFATELGSEKIIRRHVEHSRARTVGRTITNSLELEHRKTLQGNQRPTISGPMNPVDESRAKTIRIADEKDDLKYTAEHHTPTPLHGLRRVATMVTQPRRQQPPKLILLREEKDRFDAMRHIQTDTAKFKRWYALCLSVIAFALLWCVGAAVFWRCEHSVQGMTYFQGLYFCYVSLLTIGYGDLAPKSNPGRPFFVFWSLIAVPTMTILVSDLGETVINKFKHGTFKVADFTVLPKHGVWREFLERHPWILNWLEQRKQKHDMKQRLEEGFQTGPEPEPPMPTPTIEELAKDKPSNDELARRLAKKIRQTADDLRSQPPKRYPYEEWVEVTQLIRFTATKGGDGEPDNDEEGLIEWDWIGEDSPMMSKGSEAEFVLDRLCESMHRYIRQVAPPPSPEVIVQKPMPRRGPTASDNVQQSSDDIRGARDGSLDNIGPRNESFSLSDIRHADRESPLSQSSTRKDDSGTSG